MKILLSRLAAPEAWHNQNGEPYCSSIGTRAGQHDQAADYLVHRISEVPVVSIDHWGSKAIQV